MKTSRASSAVSAPQCLKKESRCSGGHVLDYVVDEATVELCPGTDLEMRLPLTQEFEQANLAPKDLDHQLHTTEVKN